MPPNMEENPKMDSCNTDRTYIEYIYIYILNMDEHGLASFFKMQRPYHAAEFWMLHQNLAAHSGAVEFLLGHWSWFNKVIK